MPEKWYTFVTRRKTTVSFTWSKVREDESMDELRRWLGDEALGPFDNEGEAIEAGVDAFDM